MRCEGAAVPEVPRKKTNDSWNLKENCTRPSFFRILFTIYIILGDDAKYADNVNTGNDAKPANQMDAIQKEKLKKDLGKRMSG